VIPFSVSVSTLSVPLPANVRKVTMAMAWQTTALVSESEY
jgi:hypothetical protein